MRVAFRPKARRDVILQVGYYLDQLAWDAAERFPQAVDEAVSHLERHPDSGSPRQFSNSKLAGLRSWPVPGFEEMRIFYTRPQTDLIRVIRVLHAKRDLGHLFGD